MLGHAALVAACAATATLPSKPARDVAAGAWPEAEQQWLDQLNSGTPVVVGPRADGAVWVEIPIECGFDAGRSAREAPLAMVLDKVAASLARQR